MVATQKKFSFLEILTPLFAVLLITSNIVASKFFDFNFLGITWSLDVGTLLLFPVLYIFGDVLSEVYGYAIARKVIWIGFAMQLIAVIIFALAVALPSSQYFDGQPAFVRVLGSVPPLVLASLLGYLTGSFLNSFVMVKMKAKMVSWDPNHKWLPLRTIASTIVGECADTAIFVGVGTLFGVFPKEIALMMFFTQWGLKTLVEAVMTPITVVVVKKIKAHEGIDTIGVAADDSYNPFHGITKLFKKRAA